MSRLIKRYGNRKLYDAGKPLRDSRSDRLLRETGRGSPRARQRGGENLTAVTFAQIILEEGGNNGLLPLPILRKIIEHGEATLQDIATRVDRGIEAIGSIGKPATRAGASRPRAHRKGAARTCDFPRRQSSLRSASTNASRNRWSASRRADRQAGSAASREHRSVEERIGRLREARSPSGRLGETGSRYVIRSGRVRWSPVREDRARRVARHVFRVLPEPSRRCGCGRTRR